MDGLSGQFLTLLVIVGGLGVLGILHVMATAVRHDTELHDLKLRVHTLRREQMERLKRIAEMGPMSHGVSRSKSPGKKAA